MVNTYFGSKPWTLYISNQIFSRKTNPRDHENVSLPIKGFDFLQNNSSVLNQGILKRYMQVPMHNAKYILVIDTN